MSATWRPSPTPKELLISHRQVDDYQTCPLKYRYIHLLRVPILRHHTVVYGSTIHAVVEFYLKRRVEGNYTSLDDLLAEYERKWLNQGFLTWEHQEARKAAGREALTRFWHHEEAEGVKPTYIEKRFRLQRGPQPRARPLRPRRRGSARCRDRRLQDERGHPPEGRRPARRPESAAQDVRAGLAGDDRPPAAMGGAALHRDPRDRASRADGGKRPEEAITAVEAAAAGIRARRFEATPSRQACRYCAYNQICPFTATRE